MTRVEIPKPSIGPPMFRWRVTCDTKGVEVEGRTFLEAFEEAVEVVSARVHIAEDGLVDVLKDVPVPYGWGEPMGAVARDGEARWMPQALKYRDSSEWATTGSCAIRLPDEHEHGCPMRVMEKQPTRDERYAAAEPTSVDASMKIVVVDLGSVAIQHRYAWLVETLFGQVAWFVAGPRDVVIAEADGRPVGYVMPVIGGGKKR